MKKEKKYEWVKLPSGGQCYPIDSPLRKGKIKIGYLTVSDENILIGGNEVNDTIIKRKVLNKKIDTSTIINGDRDAILLWLRRTGYGEKFNVTIKDNDKEYDTIIKLSNIKNNTFLLNGDKDGHFMFFMKNNDILRFKYLTKDEISFIKKESNNDDEFYVDFLKKFAKFITVMINNNKDDEYISTYINNMPTNDLLIYIEFVQDNIPSIDNVVTVKIPKQYGGGIKKAKLIIDEDFLINV